MIWYFLKPCVRVLIYCKMTLFLLRWWCHFDDDNYVHPGHLVEVLNWYNWSKPVYLGRRSRQNTGVRNATNF